MRSSTALRSCPSQKPATLQKQRQVGHFVRGCERDQLGPQNKSNDPSARFFPLDAAVALMVLLLT